MFNRQERTALKVEKILSPDLEVFVPYDVVLHIGGAHDEAALRWHLCSTGRFSQTADLIMSALGWGW